MMSKEEFRVICDAVGGPKVVADFVPTTIRSVDHWRAGTRQIRPPVEARIRELYRQHMEGAC